MRLQVTNTLDDRATDWDDVVGRMARPSPFLRSWWLGSAAGADPCIVTVDDGTRLLGGAAFERDVLGRGPAALERLRSLGQGELAPDHLDVVAAPADAPVVVRAVVDWLRRPGRRLVDLDGLAADGALGRVLADRVIERIPAPFATLDAPDAATYLAARPGQLRSTVKRSAKRIATAGATIDVVDGTDPDAVARALADLARLHDHRWEEASGFLGAWPRFVRAATVGMAAGDVEITEVTAPDGAVVATEIDLLVAGRTAFYQAGRSTDREWRGAGSVLRSDIIGRSAAAGRTEYDLLRGDESYKGDWATGRRDLVRARFGVGDAGLAVAAGLRAWRSAAPRVATARRRVSELGERLRPPAASG